MGFVRRLTGKTAAGAAKKAGEIQSQAATDAAGNVLQAGQQAGVLLDPFAKVGQQGLDQSQFLTDPQAQFDFLQSNPLFQSALDNANRNTLQLSAAQGRLSAGDTLKSLSQNTLLAASPLIQQQKGSILDTLGFGERTALNQGNILQSTSANQGNLLTGAAAAQAGGIVGAENARSAGLQNLINIGSKAATIGFGG